MLALEDQRVAAHAWTKQKLALMASARAAGPDGWDATALEFG
jgi:hypothetical protein